MVRAIAALLLGLCGAAPVSAQELLGGYYALIGKEDMYNSSGKRLGDFCAIIQQDRANFHRFGIRHEMDDDDPWFTTQAARKLLGASCVIGSGSEYIPAAVLRGEPRFVRVQVFGQAGVPQWVEVHEGAG